MFTPEGPKITIITVVKNGEAHLEQCICSVLDQTYKNIEYVIIDGQSNDCTLDIIQKYQNLLTYWISEPDSGIYDGMNKGIQASTGDWILFINSDDYLANSNVIEEVISFLKTATSLVVYGKIQYITPTGVKLTFGLDWTKLKENFRNTSMLNLCHQATFHSKKLFTNNLYDISYKIAGDYELLYRYLKDHDATFIPLQISTMRGGGMSNRNYKKLFQEHCRIFIKNKNYKFFLSSYFIKHFINTYARYWSNKLFGNNLIYRIKRYFKF